MRCKSCGKIMVLEKGMCHPCAVERAEKAEAKLKEYGERLKDSPIPCRDPLHCKGRDLALEAAEARVKELDDMVKELKAQNVKWVKRAHEMSLEYTEGDFWQIKQWDKEDEEETER